MEKASSLCGMNPLELFKNYSCFHSLKQNDGEQLEAFASRVTQQSLLIETFCDEDRVLQARNQILWGMKCPIDRDRAIVNNCSLEDLLNGCESQVKTEVFDDSINNHELSLKLTSDHEDLESSMEQELCDSDYLFEEDFQSTIKTECEEQGDEPTLPKTSLDTDAIGSQRSNGTTLFCSDCNTKYLTESALAEHRKREYPCPDCEISTPCLKQFRCHTVELHSKYFCDSCETYYRSAYILKKHRADAHILKKNSCQFCSSEFPNRLAYRSHTENACPECRHCYPSREEAAQHMKDVHQRLLKNQCHICDKVLCGNYALKIHLKTMHDPSSHIYQCEICSRKFALQRLLTSHIHRVHLKKRLFRCEKCCKGFNSPKELQRHIDGVHERKVASICHICSKVFYHESGLKRHIERVHEGIKHHKCKSCEMEFYNRSELVKHNKAIHEKSLDFKCEYCGRLFNRKSVMVQHVKSLHTNEKNYKCSICGKKYVSKYHMTRHIKEGHEHYTRDCDICHKPFAGYGTGNLKKHKRTVHGIK